MVGVAGFEPAASCSQGTRANQAALHPEHAVYKSLAEKWQVPAGCEVRILRADKHWLPRGAIFQLNQPVAGEY